MHGCSRVKRIHRVNPPQNHQISRTSCCKFQGKLLQNGGPFMVANIAKNAEHGPLSPRDTVQAGDVGQDLMRNDVQLLTAGGIGRCHKERTVLRKNCNIFGG